MKIFETKAMQNYAKWASKPNVVKNINTYLPQVQSLFVVGIYVYDIYKSSIPEKNKKTMIYHDLYSGLVGILTSAGLTKLIDKYKNSVILELEKLNQTKNIRNITNICNGVKIATPILITSFIMRYFNPVIAIPISEYVDKIINKVKGENK